jgi:ribonuclease HI
VFSNSLNVCTNMETEAHALLRGLKVYVLRKFNKVLIETDSMAFSKQFYLEQKNPWHLKEVFNHIFHLAGKLPLCQVDKCL